MYYSLAVYALFCDVSIDFVLEFWSGAARFAMAPSVINFVRDFTIFLKIFIIN